MFFIWLSLPFLLQLCGGIEINPDLHKNQLKFPWGVNFKYTGLLHHNLARVWVVTKIKVPPKNKFHFPSVNLKPDCNFTSTPNLTKDPSAPPGLRLISNYNYASRYTLRDHCEDSLPAFSLFEARETYYRNKLTKLVEEDLFGPLESYRSLGKRSKRFASLIISAVMGLVTLAVEGISGYLQRKREKAMAKAMDALHRAQVENYDSLQRYQDDLLLYGSYSLNSTTHILDTLEGMYYNQASLSETIMALPNNTWMLHYQTARGLDRYQSHLMLHTLTQKHKIDFLYELLIGEVEKLITGISTLSKGYLPLELFPLSFLKNITHRVAEELRKDRSSYHLAFDHESAYYDMQLATFSLDKFYNLIVTFPVFIVPLQHQPFSLYEIETVPVPIDNTDDNAQRFSELEIQKVYFAATDSAYIQVREPELFRCKIIQGQYFCEETFMVKHAHHHTCESTVFYDRDPGLVTQKCTFKFTHNKTVTPSVLDGGDKLVLANVRIEHSPTCNPMQLPRIPNKQYSLAPR